jgi:hypothetical protein
MPPKLSFNVPGRLWEFRLQKIVSELPYGIFLGPAIKLVCTPIPKNNSATAETPYQDGIGALEQGLIFDDLPNEIVFTNSPFMAFGHHQPQLSSTPQSILPFAETLPENINKLKLIARSFH